MCYESVCYEVCAIRTVYVSDLIRQGLFLAPLFNLSVTIPPEELKWRLVFIK